jgi:nitric oxide reductase activation protein
MGDHRTNDTDLARLRAATVVTTTPTLAVGTEVLAQMCNEVLELRQEIIDLGNINQDLEGTLHDVEQARDSYEAMWNGEAQLANRLGSERDLLRSALLDILVLTDPASGIHGLAEAALDAVTSDPKKGETP